MKKEFLSKIKFTLPTYKYIVLFLSVLGIVMDIFLIGYFIFDLIILFLIGLWVLSVWLCGFESKISIGGGLVLLIICPFWLIFDQELIAEKFAIWAYMFLVVGVGQMFIEYLKEEK